MHREGIDQNNVQPEDILCDFCGSAAWASNLPCVEGHRGSIVCGPCLTRAYTVLVLQNQNVSTSDTCRMCLEDKETQFWRGDVEPNATICTRCVKQSAGVLTKSKHWDWVKPTDG